MQANPSTRWKNDVLELVESYDFGLVEVYDAGPGFREDEECRCDFCGTPLRYTAVVAAESNPDIKREVGLDCLEHAMGSSWSHLQDVERQIENLKEEAKKERRREAYAEEYEEMIKWLEMRLEISENSFLRDMYEVLTTGESKFSRKMEEAVKDNMEAYDLQALKRKQEKIEEWKDRVDGLLEEIIEKDAIEFSEGGEYSIGRPYDEGRCSYDFVKDVREYLENNDDLTKRQMEVLNDIAQTYSNREVWSES